MTSLSNIYNSLKLALVNRWVSTRFNLLSSSVVGVTAAIAIMNPNISASLAGFALAFASTVTNDVSHYTLPYTADSNSKNDLAPIHGKALCWIGTIYGKHRSAALNCRFSCLCQVAVERVKEYSELPKEGPEFVEPRPPEFWPVEGYCIVDLKFALY